MLAVKVDHVAPLSALCSMRYPTIVCTADPLVVSVGAVHDNVSSVLEVDEADKLVGARGALNTKASVGMLHEPAPRVVIARTRIETPEFAVNPVRTYESVPDVGVVVAIVVHTDVFAARPPPLRGAVWISYPVIVPLT